MKKYSLETKDYECLVCGNKLVEDPDGEWVKHEPWMDYFENHRFGGSIIDSSHPKEPTICVKCKHIKEFGEVAKGLFGNNVDALTDFAFSKPGMMYSFPQCDKGEINFVDGGYKRCPCSDKNHGSCPDYDPK